jgi:hypothetical protein
VPPAARTRNVFAGKEKTRVTSESANDVAAEPEDLSDDLVDDLSEALSHELPPGAASSADSAGEPISYEQFGVNFIRMVLHEQRILESINRLLGEKIELGPMGAGPGRLFATARATGWFKDTYGNEVVDDLLAYRVYLPIDVDFQLEIAKDVNHFKAEVLLPLSLTVRVEHPMTIVWDITPPQEEEVTIRVETGKRRSAVLQRLSGLDAELRRFLIRVIEKELDKPHIYKATHLDMATIIDAAWPVIADQFLPAEPAQDGVRPDPEE